MPGLPSSLIIFVVIDFCMLPDLPQACIQWPNWIPDSEVLAAVEYLDWPEVIRFERLRYFLRVLLHAVSILFAVLENSATSNASWSAIIFVDICFLHSVVGKQTNMPNPEEDFDAVCQWAIDNPKRWIRITKRAKLLYIKRQRNYVSVAPCLRPIHDMLDELGIPHVPDPARPKKITGAIVGDLAYKCEDSTKSFNSLQALQLHKAYEHKQHTEAMKWVTDDSVCHACLRKFPSAKKLHRHLQYTKLGMTCCQPSLEAHFDPFHVAVDIRSCKKRSGSHTQRALHGSKNDRGPVSQLYGPLIPLVTSALPQTTAPEAGNPHAQGQQDQPRRPHSVLAVLCPCVHLQPVIILHIYSGRQRPGCMKMLAPLIYGFARLDVHVLAIDIVSDNPAHNQLDPSILAFFLAAIFSERIRALIAGPPCETWSAVREREVVGRLIGVLRTLPMPWGTKDLSVKHLDKLYVAS